MILMKPSFAVRGHIPSVAVTSGQRYILGHATRDMWTTVKGRWYKKRVMESYSTTRTGQCHDSSWQRTGKTTY